MPKFTKSFVFSLLFSLTLFVVTQASAAVPASNPVAEVTSANQPHKQSRMQAWLVKKVMQKIEKKKAKIDKLYKEGKISKAKKDLSKLSLIGLILVILGLVFLLLTSSLALLGTLLVVIGLVLLLVGLI